MTSIIILLQRAEPKVDKSCENGDSSSDMLLRDGWQVLKKISRKDIVSSRYPRESSRLVFFSL